MKIVTTKIKLVLLLGVVVLLGMGVLHLVVSRMTVSALDVPIANVSAADFAESKRNALSLIEALVNHGFRVRDGVWTTTLLPQKATFLQVTLFSGNQYWFAAAASLPARRMKLLLYDASGEAITLDLWKDDQTIPGGRIMGGVTAPHSGQYYVGLELMDSHDHAPANASLVYAYK